MNTQTITFSSVSKSFDKGHSYALKDITLEIGKGKLVGLAGPDAAGKTTFLRLLAGLLRPTSGKVTIFGLDTVVDQKELNTITGYMPQRFGLYEDLTVAENLELYAELHGLSRQTREKQFARILTFTTLEPFQKRLAGNLSGGMKQKLGLGCTLLSNPRLLLLDEPSVGVDPVSRRALWTLVHDLISDEMTVLWSTAYLDEADRCDEIILLNKGELLYQGRPSDLAAQMKGRVFSVSEFGQDRRRFLQKALENPQIIDGVIQGSHVRLVTAKDAILPYPSTDPRLEDAFMDRLGGVGTKISPLKKEGAVFTKETLIEARHLYKKFDHFEAVKDVNFSVQRGEVFGLLGPNGAGKSTIFKMLCGLLKPTSGEALISGISLQDAGSLARSKIGYMAQKFSLYDNMTVAQNIHFFYGLYPHKGDLVEKLIESFSLKDVLNVPVKELPIGYKQRLALVSAVMHEPDALFLDEPTSGVDPITRREFWGHINCLVEAGVAIIVTTHFMDEAEYCDRIGLVDQGVLLKIGSPEDLKKAAASSALPAPTLEDAFIALSQRKGE